MSRIKSRDTIFEKRFFKLLSARIYPQGYRYRKHYTKLIGKPDIVFVGKRTAVFLDSDFWHGKNPRSSRPSTHESFWRKKISRNIARDKFVSRELRKGGWKIFRFSEKMVAGSPESAVRLIEDRLKR